MIKKNEKTRQRRPIVNVAYDKPFASEAAERDFLYRFHTAVAEDLLEDVEAITEQSDGQKISEWEWASGGYSRSGWYYILATFVQDEDGVCEVRQELLGGADDFLKMSMGEESA